MTKLSIQAQTAGGINLACDTIENVYTNAGCNHMVDIHLKRKQKGMSCIKSSCCLLILILLIVLGVLYVVKIYQNNIELKEQIE